MTTVAALHRTGSIIGIHDPHAVGARCPWAGPGFFTQVAPVWESPEKPFADRPLRLVVRRAVPNFAARSIRSGAFRQQSCPQRRGQLSHVSEDTGEMHHPVTLWSDARRRVWPPTSSSMVHIRAA